jgi:equilibrative nucleoside transporter 1/2/3
MYPVVLNTIVFGIMAITVETSIGGAKYFWLTLFLLALTGATTSFFQVAVFAEASRFPPQYVQAVMR